MLLTVNSLSKLLISLFLLLTVTACTTSLWADKYYQEELTGFFIDEKNQKLIVSGKQYSYVFDLEQELKSALLLSRTVLMQPSFKQFSVSEKNQIQGQFSLSLPDDALSNVDSQQLNNSGFEENRASFVMLGKRYQLDGKLPQVNLDKSIKIQIKRPRKGAETVGSIVATPVAITFDAFVTVPATLVMVMIMALGSP